MKTIYVLTDTTKEAPPQSFMEHISNTVLVYDCNRNFIGEDTYNLKLKRWMVSRDTAKYWLKKIDKQIFIETDVIEDSYGMVKPFNNLERQIRVKKI